MQTRLIQKDYRRREVDKEQINYVVDEIQRLKTSEGCPHLCPYCYEPDELKVFPIPKIIKDYVQILDMNFLWQPDVIERIRQLKRPKAVYEAVCGFDFRFMNQEIANELKKSRFIKIRIAWDWRLKDQYKIKDCIDMFLKAGYKRHDISCFILTNWKIPKSECEKKLDLLKVWHIKVCDCCYDGGYAIAIPEFWAEQEIREFRAKCRKHNQIVNFKIDPEA